MEPDEIAGRVELEYLGSQFKVNPNEDHGYRRG
jgi:hypothetical protein